MGFLEKPKDRVRAASGTVGGLVTMNANGIDRVDDDAWYVLSESRLRQKLHQSGLWGPWQSELLIDDFDDFFAE